LGWSRAVVFRLRQFWSGTTTWLAGLHLSGAALRQRGWLVQAERSITTGQAAGRRVEQTAKLLWQVRMLLTPERTGPRVLRMPDAQLPPDRSITTSTF